MNTGGEAHHTNAAPDLLQQGAGGSSLHFSLGNQNPSSVSTTGAPSSTSGGSGELIGDLDNDDFFARLGGGGAPSPMGATTVSTI